MLYSALVVDDTKSTREALVAALRALGVKDVLSAVDGADALKKLEGRINYFDAIFTDLQMPEIDGITLIDRIGSLGYHGSVVICSAMEQKIIDLAIELARRKQVHLVGYLPRTLDMNYLLNMISRAESITGNRPIPDNLIKKKDLIEALQQKTILPYFQPQVDSRTRTITGLEVLSRLVIPRTNEIIKPDRFIPVALKFDLINELTYVLMESCLQQAKALASEFPHLNFKISINIVPSQLDYADLPSEIMNLCRKHQCPAERITIELTESHVIETDTRLMNIDRLRLFGFGCSLDDFGTGFTNIRQLESYPFTEVKLDRAYVQNIDSDALSQAMFRHIYSAAHSLKIPLVAEGVETEAEYEFLESMDGVIVQGYLISRPKPFSEIKRWIKAWEKQHAKP